MLSCKLQFVDVLQLVFLAPLGHFPMLWCQQYENLNFAFVQRVLKLGLWVSDLIISNICSEYVSFITNAF